MPLRVRLVALDEAVGANLTGAVDRERHVQTLRLPRVAVIAGDGSDPNSYGAIWFMFERELGLPFTPITLATLGRADLRKYDVIVFPDGESGEASYEEVARPDTIEALKTWVKQGGVLIGVRPLG